LDTFESSYKVGTDVEGKIVRIIEKGVILELPLGVDGFVPMSHLSQTPIKNIADSFHMGDVLPARVIEFDKESKRIVLSVIEYLRGKEQSIVDNYVSSHKLTPMTMKESSRRRHRRRTPIIHRPMTSKARSCSVCSATPCRAY